MLIWLLAKMQTQYAEGFADALKITIKSCGCLANSPENKKILFVQNDIPFCSHKINSTAVDGP